MYHVCIQYHFNWVLWFHKVCNSCLSINELTVSRISCLGIVSFLVFSCSLPSLPESITRTLTAMEASVWIFFGHSGRLHLQLAKVETDSFETIVLFNLFWDYYSNNLEITWKGTGIYWLCVLNNLWYSHTKTIVTFQWLYSVFMFIKWSDISHGWVFAVAEGLT